MAFQVVGVKPTPYGGGERAEGGPSLTTPRGFPRIDRSNPASVPYRERHDDHHALGPRLRKRDGGAVSTGDSSIVSGTRTRLHPGDDNEAVRWRCCCGSSGTGPEAGMTACVCRTAALRSPWIWSTMASATCSRPASTASAGFRRWPQDRAPLSSARPRRGRARVAPEAAWDHASRSRGQHRPLATIKPHRLPEDRLGAGQLPSLESHRPRLWHRQFDSLRRWIYKLVTIGPLGKPWAALNAATPPDTEVPAAL